MTGRRVADLRSMAEVRSVSLKEAVREIRIQAGRINRAGKALGALLKSIDLPTEAEMVQMREGTHPLTWEAHLIGTIIRAVVNLDTCEKDLRLAVKKRLLDRLEYEWKQGRRLKSVELRHIEAAVAALRTSAEGPCAEPRRLHGE